MPTSSRRTTLATVNRNDGEDGGVIESASDYFGNSSKTRSKKRMSMAPRMMGGASSGSTNINDNNDTRQQRKSVGKPKTPSRRKSVSATSHLQNHHVHPHNITRIDPRPLNDKNYLNSCIRQLTNFLISSGYEHPVSHKTLSRPSSKDFNQIVTFLLRRVDPTFFDKSLKFEDEVALAFKSLGYPFPISKTGLVAAGSIHTWPTLLAALTWLIEVLSCEDTNQDEALKKSDPDESMILPDPGEVEPIDELQEILFKTDGIFFQFLSDSYQAFLSNNDDRCDQLEEIYLDDYENDNLIIEREIERKTDVNASLVEEIENLGKNGLSLPELVKRKEDLCVELEKYRNLVKTFKDHKKALQIKVDQRTTDFQKIQEKLQNTRGRLNEMKDKIQSQPFSMDQAKEMYTEQTKLNENMSSVNKEKEHYQKQTWELEFRMKSLLEDIRVEMDRCNDKIVSLLKDKTMIMILKENSLKTLKQAAFIGQDLNSCLIPFLHQTKQEYMRRSTQATQTHNELLEKCKLSDQNISSVEVSIMDAENEKKKLENFLRKENEKEHESVRSLLKETESLTMKTSALRDPAALEDAIGKLETRSIQLACRREQLQHEGEQKKEAVQKEIFDALCAIAEHKEYIQAKLMDLNKYASDCAQQTTKLYALEN